MGATWRGYKTGWNVIRVLLRTYAFSTGSKMLLLGFDNTRPSEMKGTCERRIARRFDAKVSDLILEIQE